MNELQLKIFNLLKEMKPEVDFSNFDPDKSLSYYDFDSLDMMNLYFHIEEKLNCQLELTDDEHVEIFSLNTLIKCIK